MKILGYIDGGSASLIVSALVGGIAGIAVVAKLGWHRLVGVFVPSTRRRLKEERAAAATSSQPPTSTP